jgi:uncharacterized delta-60 repeat protein
VRGWNSLRSVLAGVFTGLLATAAPAAALPPGVVQTPLRDSAFGIAIAQQRDGKLLVGATVSEGDRAGFGVLRYSKKGLVDRRFGTRGNTVVGVGARAFEDVEDIAVLPDGRILVGGTVATDEQSANALTGEGPADFVTNQTDFGFAQLLRSGAPDRGFGGGDGVATITAPAGHSTDEAMRWMAPAGGRIFFGGESLDAMNRRGCVMAADTKPAPLPGWSSPCTTPPDMGAAGFDDALVQPDGGVVVAFDAEDAEDHLHIGVARLRADGSVDTGFGNQGFTSIDLGVLEGGSLEFKLAPGKDGGFVVGGSRAGQVVLVAVTGSGELDPAFGTGGQVAADFVPGDGEYVSDLVTLADGSTAVVAGTDSGQDRATIVARFDRSGRAVERFGRRGLVVLRHAQLGYWGVQTGGAVARKGGGLVVAGTGFDVRTARQRVVTLIGLTPAGKLDRRFGRR